MSVVAVENGAFFMSDRGFFAINDGGVASISKQIQPIIVRQFDFAQAPNVVVGHHRMFEEVWWFLPGQGVFVYNYEKKAWTGPMSGIFLDTTVTSFFEGRNTTNQPVLFFTGSNGYVYEVDAPNQYKDDVQADGDGGIGFTMAVQLKRFFARDLVTRKAWRWVYLTAQLRGNRNVQLEMSTETGSAAVPVVGAYGGVWDPDEVFDPTQSWGGPDMVLYRVPAGATGPYLDVTISDSGDCDAIYAAAQVIAYSLGMR
jgi:hypothetical protein